MNFKKIICFILILATSFLSSCSRGSSTPKSSAKDITSLSIGDRVGVISGTNITVIMPYGSSVTNLTPTIEVSAKASVSPASEVAQDFADPIEYTVTAEDGTIKAYMVTVVVAASSDKNIVSFEILGVPGTIVGTGITLTVPFGTDPSSLTPTIAITGSSVSPASGVAKDFTDPVLYTVTAADGSKKNYTVTVTVALSSDKNITSFEILGAHGVITDTDIAVTVPFGTDPSSLTPTIVITGVSVAPASGVVQDFSDPVPYIVTAADSTTKTYTVTVTVTPPSSNKNISSFSILGAVGTIVGTNIAVTVPYETDVSSLTPTIVITGVSVDPASGVAQNFTSPVHYLVTAEDTSTKEYIVTVTVAGRPAGYKSTFSADGVSFKLAYMPGGLTFPTGADDSGTATVANAYWVGESEVTYELWSTVYAWATSNGYSFANPGVDGDSGGGGDPSHPVTTLTWRDAMVFSNAITEWYNAKNGTSYTCAYYTDAGYLTPIRTSTNAAICGVDGCQDRPYVRATATGFRLLSSNEWELASRYIGTTAPVISPLSTDVVTTNVGGTTYYWTPGDYASGATASTVSSPATHAVAWYNAGVTEPVMSLNANAIGVYDLSGSIWEWCFDLSGSDRVRRGGGWYSGAGYMSIGSVYASAPNFKFDQIGIRLAMKDAGIP